MSDPLRLPGFVTAHSHAFQRALRGRAQGDDFWAWRDAMLSLADELSPAEVRSGYEATYREMRAAGYTAVGEFHYVGFEEAKAALEAAEAAGIAIVLLLAAYARGGLERFRQPSVAAYLEQVEELRASGARVGLAPHSVRACPADWLEEIGRYAEREGLVLHIHADEQPIARAAPFDVDERFQAAVPLVAGIMIRVIATLRIVEQFRKANLVELPQEIFTVPVVATAHELVQEAIIRVASARAPPPGAGEEWGPDWQPVWPAPAAQKDDNTAT